MAFKFFPHVTNMEPIQVQLADGNLVTTPSESFQVTVDEAVHAGLSN